MAVERHRPQTGRLGYSGAVTISAVRLSDGHTTSLWSDTVTLGPGPGAMAWMHMPGLAALNASESVVTAVAQDGNAATVCSNVVLLAPPKQLELPKATVQVQFRKDDDPFAITLVSDQVALFVTPHLITHSQHLTHSLTHSPSLTHSLTHSLIHSLTHSLRTNAGGGQGLGQGEPLGPG